MPAARSGAGNLTTRANTGTACAISSSWEAIASPCQLPRATSSSTSIPENQEGSHHLRRRRESAPSAEREYRPRLEFQRRGHPAGAGQPGRARHGAQSDLHELQQFSHASANAPGYLLDRRGEHAGRGQLGQAGPLGMSFTPAAGHDPNYMYQGLILPDKTIAVTSGYSASILIVDYTAKTVKKPSAAKGSPMQRPSSRTSTLATKFCPMVTLSSPTGKAMAPEMAAPASSSWNTTHQDCWYGNGNRLPAWCPRSITSSSSTGLIPPSSTTTSTVCLPRSRSRRQSVKCTNSNPSYICIGQSGLETQS
jgi:hypothetical protein